MASAQLRASVNSGAVQTGAITVANSDTIQLDAASYVGWASPAARWEIYAFPVGFPEPAGWDTDSVTQSDGSTATVYYYLGTTPPSFTAPASPLWGKLGLSLLVNGSVFDDATSLEIVSPSGLHDMMWREGRQFGSWKKWVGDHQENLLTLETALASGIVLAGAGMTKTGITLNVIANGDGSITVNANDIQVGVLASDAQHGNRGGGGIHANAVPGGAAGFLTGAFATDLTNATSAATVSTLVKRDGSGISTFAKVYTVEVDSVTGNLELSYEGNPQVTLGASGTQVIAEFVEAFSGPAAAGLVRAANNTTGIGWKNQAGTGDVPIAVNASDTVVIGDNTHTDGHEARVATGGLWKWIVNNVEKARGTATGWATDILSELTADAGVTIDGLLVKDSHLPAKYRWRAFTWAKDADDALAATTTSRRPFAVATYACTVTDVNYTAHDALTAHDTDNVTVSVYAYNASGTLVGKVAEWTSTIAGGGLTAEDERDFGTITNASLSAGYKLAVEVTKNGAGVALPAGILTVNTTLD